MKILIITRGAWRNDNNTGNTYSNIFSWLKREEIINIYCSSEEPDNQLCSKYYCIPESEIVSSLFNPTKKIGFEGYYKTTNEKDRLDKYRVKRKPIYYFLREFFWMKSKWCNDNFNSFIKENNPDIVFMAGYDNIYMHRIYKYILKKTNACGVLFFMDDYFSKTFKKLDFITTIRKKMSRESMKKISKMSKLHYAISQKQCDEYGEIFKTKINILYKGFNFQKEKPNHVLKNPLKIVYAGNVMQGRWKMLYEIAKVLKKINSNDIKAVMDIYTKNIINDDIMDKLTIKGSSYFRGSLTADKVSDIIKNADIVLHVESLDKVESLKTRLSFSTKIVDYFVEAKCIFSVGWTDAASIDYLIRNDAAVVANNISDIEKKLKQLVDNPDLIAEYENKAWECGKKYHEIGNIQNELMTDFERLLT